MEKVRYGYNKAEYKKFFSNAWRYLILFSLLYCTHYCTRGNLSNAKLLMPFTDSQLGIISSALFWSYGVGHLINGRLGEIVGVRRFIILSVALSIVANVVLGFQNSFGVIVVVWALNGFFQSMAWSPGVSSLASWWPGDKRGFATGFANAFSGFGSALVGVMVAVSFALFPNLGWKAAFFFPAILPAVMLVIYMIFAKPGPKAIGLKDYEEENADRAAQEAEMAKIAKEKGVLFPYLHLLKNKTFIVWMVVIFCSGLARYGLVEWIPEYLYSVANKDAVVAILVSALLPIGMGVGTLVIPTLTDKFCPNNRLLAAVASGLAAAICIIGFMLLNPNSDFQFVVMIILLFFAGFFIYAINGTVWTYATDIGGRFFASTATGILDFAAYMGAALQAVIYGSFADKGLWPVVFISISAFCLVISVISYISSRKKTEKKKEVKKDSSQILTKNVKTVTAYAVLLGVLAVILAVGLTVCFTLSKGIL